MGPQNWLPTRKSNASHAPPKKMGINYVRYVNNTQERQTLLHPPVNLFVQACLSTICRWVSAAPSRVSRFWGCAICASSAGIVRWFGCVAASWGLRNWAVRASHRLLHLKNSFKTEFPHIVNPKPLNVASRTDRTGSILSCKISTGEYQTVLIFSISQRLI